MADTVSEEEKTHYRCDKCGVEVDQHGEGSIEGWLHTWAFNPQATITLKQGPRGIAPELNPNSLALCGGTWRRHDVDGNDSSGA